MMSKMLDHGAVHPAHRAQHHDPLSYEAHANYAANASQDWKHLLLIGNERNWPIDQVAILSEN